MRAAVEADLKQLKLIFSIYERYDKAISTGEIHTELAERLKKNSITAAKPRICSFTALCSKVKTGRMCRAAA